MRLARALYQRLGRQTVTVIPPNREPCFDEGALAMAAGAQEMSESLFTSHASQAVTSKALKVIDEFLVRLRFTWNPWECAFEKTRPMWMRCSARCRRDGRRQGDTKLPVRLKQFAGTQVHHPLRRAQHHRVRIEVGRGDYQP